MSRHKLVKGLDLDEELDDFDAVANDDYDDDVSTEDKGTDRCKRLLAEMLNAKDSEN